MFKTSSNFLTDFSKAVFFVFFVDHFCYLCFVFVLSVDERLVITCWERADLLALMYVKFSCVLSLPI